MDLGYGGLQSSIRPRCRNSDHNDGTDGLTDGHPTVAFRSDGRERVPSKMTLVRDASVVLCAGFVVVVVVCVEHQLGVVWSTGRHTAVDR